MLREQYQDRRQSLWTDFDQAHGNPYNIDAVPFCTKTRTRLMAWLHRDYTDDILSSNQNVGD